MTKEEKLGKGPAFPIGAELLDRCGHVAFSHLGADVRTYVATKVFSALITNGDMRCSPEHTASVAVNYTNALLKELEK